MSCTLEEIQEQKEEKTMSHIKLTSLDHLAGGILLALNYWVKLS